MTKKTKAATMLPSPPPLFLKPPPHVLIAVASAVVHAEEFLSPGGHPADKVAFNSALSAPGVREWMQAMTEAALLPVKR